MTIEEWAREPRATRLERLTRLPDELATAIQHQSEDVLSRRPDGKNWAAKEVICHLRDTEEVFGVRMEQVLAMDVDPTVVITNPDRWAEERQYLRNDVGDALAAFGRRRTETLAVFAKLTPADWEKAALHPTLGRLTLDGFLSVMAFHDDIHLDQLMRALDGRA
ncbi:MAG TPA: DinB family protein [Candidatus Tectomicrobia bacterium]|nr:DinB family protein [Candidatus Tectomicrobia bacterium]